MTKLKKGIIIWGVLCILMFLFGAYDRHSKLFEWERIVFLFFYFLVSLFITYVIVPKFLYTKKVFLFFLFVLITLFVSALIEEFVLEQIFYPNTMGNSHKVILAILEILPPILIFTSVKFAWDAFEKENKIEKITRLAVENELQFLNSQINPHFLFNNLNNLYAFAIEKSPETPKIILQLSSILRYMLYECRKPKVLLKDEVDNIIQFVELYKKQMSSDAKLEFKTSLDQSNYEISPLILIVFVENAIKHSQSSLIDSIEIDIQIETKNNRLYFSCRNRFELQTNHDKLDKGIGLENVKSKLELVYPNKYNLSIKEENSYYNVELEIIL
jgi:hypothetical protein